MQGTVSAIEPQEEDHGNYEVTYSAEEVTDFQLLLKKAASQNRSRSANANTNENLTVTQLLEVREYDDGLIETDYAFTEFSLDEATARSAEIDWQGDPTSTTQVQNHIEGYSASCTLYYTARCTGTSFTPVIRYKISKVTGQVVKMQVTSTTITKANLGYVLSSSKYKQTSCSYKNGAGTGGQTFTLSCNDSGWYYSPPSDPNTFYGEGLGGYFDVYASNGDSVAIITMPV